MVYLHLFEAYKKERSGVVFAIELNLLPCVLHSKIKGGVRRTEGLIFTTKKSMKSFQPLSYIANAAPRNVTGHGRGEGEMQSIAFARIHVYSHCFFIEPC